MRISNYCCVPPVPSRRGFTLIELLVVVLVLGVLAAIGLSYYGRAAERSRVSEVEQLFGSVVQNERMARLNGGLYTESWAELSTMPASVKAAKIYCTRAENTDGQTSCPKDNNGFRVELFGSAAPDPEAVVLATRENGGAFGPYQLYRFYEDDDTVYCKAETDAGQTLCLMFGDEDVYKEPSRQPPAASSGGGEEQPEEPEEPGRHIIRTETCNGWEAISVCRMEYYDDGTSVKVKNAPTQIQRTDYDAAGNTTFYTVWNKDGTPDHQDTYENGNVVKSTGYNADGTVSYVDYKTAGDRTQRVAFNAEGAVKSVTNYDPKTDNKLNYLVYNHDKGTYTEYVYAADGNTVVSSTEKPGRPTQTRPDSFCSTNPDLC